MAFRSGRVLGPGFLCACLLAAGLGGLSLLVYPEIVCSQTASSIHDFSDEGGGRHFTGPVCAECHWPHLSPAGPNQGVLYPRAIAIGTYGRAYGRFCLDCHGRPGTPLNAFLAVSDPRWQSVVSTSRTLPPAHVQNPVQFSDCTAVCHRHRN